jgi:hypothetical protein
MFCVTAYLYMQNYDQRRLWRLLLFTLHPLATVLEAVSGVSNLDFQAYKGNVDNLDPCIGLRFFTPCFQGSSTAIKSLEPNQPPHGSCSKSKHEFLSEHQNIWLAWSLVSNIIYGISSVLVEMVGTGPICTPGRCS